MEVGGRTGAATGIGPTRTVRRLSELPRRSVEDDDDSIPEGWSVVDFSEGVPKELD